ncbi:hypothetical protein GWK47_033457 [Chionoecetes opilio]|uniref:Uncharacterized protein n=1 Tax=Chionoecetes opilio TaxID=41210 RepID=A0A8J5D404_CHIOP|nr:hypothetical protein GWK47_033457 [Chionoecetes opilio]
MADSDVLIELRQLRAQLHDLTEARSGHDDVVRDLGDAVASLKKENAELRELLGKRGVPSSPVPLPRRRVAAWTQVKNKETGRGRPQTPPPETRNSFATLVDECAEVGVGKTVEPSLSSGFPAFLQQAITCDGCNKWQHRICGINISQAQYIKAVREGTDIKWSCQQCSTPNTPPRPDLTQLSTPPASHFPPAKRQRLFSLSSSPDVAHLLNTSDVSFTDLPSHSTADVGFCTPCWCPSGNRGIQVISHPKSIG